ncbi:hypothetical protein BANRA_05956 [Klebsiella variicola]|nr:hypothetical protein BANRA_05956 [Klebsiella variicola]
MLLSSTRKDWLGNVRGDVLAGIVVALALIPEAIAFSIIAGVDPQGSTLRSVFPSLWPSSAAVRHDIVRHRCDGAAADHACKDHGLQYLLAASALTGVLQLAAGYLKLGSLMRLPLGGHRFRERAGHPDIYGAAAGADQRHRHVYALTAAGLGIIYLFPYLNKTISPLVCIIVLTAISSCRRAHR